jgi:predicted ATP-grasp superfamily ATP-dependent carboligase
MVTAPDLKDEEKVIRTLTEVGQELKLKGWVLYPTRDETVAMLSRHRQALGGYFRVPTPSWATVVSAWDKRNTYRLARELGIPTPRTWYPQTLEEVKHIDASLPLVIKPAIKEHFIYKTKHKAWQANTQEELVQLFEEATALTGPGEIMVQELISGDGRQQFAYCAFYKDGRALTSMVAQRRRQHPHVFGRATTFAETVDLPLLKDYSQRFLRAVDYYGLVEVEYKLDPRDGDYKLLDVNPRPWGYHTLGEAVGIDFSYELFADQIGEQVEERVSAPAGGTWVRLLTDLPTAALEMWAGRLHWRDYIASLRRVDVEAVFRYEDPLPFLAEWPLIPYLAVKRGF